MANECGAHIHVQDVLYVNHFGGSLACHTAPSSDQHLSGTLVQILANQPRLHLLLANMLKYNGKPGIHYAVPSAL